MTSASSLLRTLLIYAICLPLAIFLGYVIASPDPTRDIGTYIGVGLVLFALALPLLLRWHRILLVVTWNMCAVLYFLPGRPELWLATMWISLIISVVQVILNPRQRFISVPSITKPLIFLAVVVMVTAKCNGGIGLGALGSDTMGGKKYLFIITTIAGYFALISQRIPPHRVNLYVALFFLGYLTFAIGDVGPLVAPGLYFIFWLFPLSYQSVTTILNNPGQAGDNIARFGGLAFAGAGVFSAMLARYGIREILTARHLFRAGFFLAVAALSLLGGYRSVLITFVLTFAIVFYLEGLMRSRMLPVLLLVVALGAALIIGFVDRLPMNVQRTLSILPIQVDPVARQSAEESSKWRLQMWKDVLPMVPRYLLLGKGFGLTSSEIHQYSSGRPGEIEQISAEGSAMAGDFHNGPLSLIIPFGIWGVIGFIWLIVAGWKVLYRNYKFGDPVFRTLNVLLFAAFVTRTVFFFFIFGSFYSDITIFLGLLGLSIAINGGVAQRIVAVQPQTAARPGKGTPLRRRPMTAAPSAT